MGIVFLAIVVLLIEELLWHTGFIKRFPHAVELSQGAAFFIPPALYLYFFYQKNDEKVSQNIFHWLPGVLAYLNFIPLFNQNTAFKDCYIIDEYFDVVSKACESIYDDRWAKYFNEDFFDILFIGQFIFYAWLVYKNRNLLIEQRTKKASPKFQKWAKILVAISILAILLVILDIYVFKDSKGVFATLYLSGISFSIAYFLLRNSTLLEDNFQSQVYQNLSVEAIELDFIKFKTILKKESSEEHTSLREIADKMQVTPNQLSFILRTKQTNFKECLNEFRIEKAKSLLLSESASNYSIEGIGRQVGYKSKTTFYKHFKKNTGQTPQEFLKKPSN